jgi:hypothetical protein
LSCHDEASIYAEVRGWGVLSFTQLEGYRLHSQERDLKKKGCFQKVFIRKKGFRVTPPYTLSRPLPPEVRGTYLHLLLSPSSHLITTMQRDDWDRTEIVSEEIECEQGEVFFIQIAEESWSWGFNPTITVVDSNVGREAILKRKLILLP